MLDPTMVELVRTISALQRRVEELERAQRGIPSTVLFGADGSLIFNDFATETFKLVDAGSAGATEQDWVQVQVGGNTGYVRVYATK